MKEPKYYQQTLKHRKNFETDLIKVWFVENVILGRQVGYLSGWVGQKPFSDIGND